MKTFIVVIVVFVVILGSLWFFRIHMLNYEKKKLDDINKGNLE